MYLHVRTLDLAFAEAERALRESLSKRGFGIITEIDVQATLKKKLGIETDKYLILGACNPSFAHKALNMEPNLGVLLPCNAIVRSESGMTVVGCALPTAQLGKVGNEALMPLAQEVESLLVAAIDEVAGT